MVSLQMSKCQYFTNISITMQLVLYVPTAKVQVLNSANVCCVEICADITENRKLQAESPLESPDEDTVST